MITVSAPGAIDSGLISSRVKPMTAKCASKLKTQIVSSAAANALVSTFRLCVGQGRNF